MGTVEQGSVGMHLRFQTRQEQTVFIWQEVGKTVARVWKKNIQDKEYYYCTPNVKLSTKYLEWVVNKKGVSYNKPM